MLEKADQYEKKILERCLQGSGEQSDSTAKKFLLNFEKTGASNEGITTPNSSKMNQRYNVATQE